MTDARPRPLTVLLVEDNAGDLHLIEELLRLPAGEFRLEHVELLAPGLERLGRGGVDVVLLDLGLPDSQGDATFAAVRRAAPAVPVIILTGLGDEAVAIRMVREGAQDYLVKGDVERNVLRRAINAAG